MTRSPGWNALASLVVPGLGQLLAGRVVRAAVFGASALLVQLVAASVFSLPTGSAVTVVAGALLLPVFLVASALDAWRAARRGTGPAASKAPRAPACALFVLWVGGFSALQATWFFRTRAQPVVAASNAMAPTLLAGDRFVLDRSAYRSAARPARGDVVALELAVTDAGRVPADRAPDAPRLEVVFRIVGCPGDTVEVRAGSLVVNGVPLATSPTGESLEPDPLTREPLDVLREDDGGRSRRIALARAGRLPDFRALTLEPDRYFVLGDNRLNANDSREWGTVHRTDVTGRATHVHFSRDPLSGAIRWSRIGMLVE